LSNIEAVVKPWKKWEEKKHTSTAVASVALGCRGLPFVLEVGNPLLLR
jgi:hypothetical protein